SRDPTLATSSLSLLAPVPPHERVKAQAKTTAPAKIFSKRNTSLLLSGICLTLVGPSVLNCSFAFIAIILSEVLDNVETLRGLRQGHTVWQSSEPRKQSNKAPLCPESSGHSGAGWRPGSTSPSLHPLPESRKICQSRLAPLPFAPRLDFEPPLTSRAS